ncbi:SDR family NAD(P)-dependent oxidoreductase [Burkholderia sp. AU19243]|uniref:Oxidoreductase n=1 Tax=Burkholderia latens TaxID=488446 RepID=A0AAP1G7A1_9BURK|nr:MULTISPECIES: SDR family NAD(P)-dependent oxidoreductase [Burkholderia]AIO38995.1 short chain dehydrogenase family protein [Burkholderia cenocepacia]MBR8145043.1 SDR family NAD(P)-dependent oxidoreductase [Burkholderia vietnamiensis]AOK08356.1 oxidoreductase [Burkholderia latens]KUZ99496.1 oxidoreductase [Burkholderia latens]MBR8364982.1 SDR family NAD(P)-dependent oxidoreductase [Burkholderia sp. AU19243]
MSKVWLVTGAARGLGRSIAEAVLAAGDRLVAGARDPERLADLVERYGERVLPVALDVTDEAAAAHAVTAARDAFGRIDVLVNNAGYGHTAPFEQMGGDDFRAQIETNFFGVVNLTRAVLPTMRAQRAGHIFQVSSVGGRTSTPGLSAYQAAKWAVGGFSDVLSKEVAPFGVRVCTLEPGGMRTDWAAQAKREVDGLLPDYRPSVGKMLDLLGSYGGNEVGDPVRIAALIVGLSRRDDVPMRLLLGGDALFVCEQAETQRADEAARWRDTTLSTMFPDAKLPDGLQALKKAG